MHQRSMMEFGGRREKYKLGRKIGNRSFSELYLGVNLRSGEEVAVKMMARDRLNNTNKHLRSQVQESSSNVRAAKRQRQAPSQNQVKSSLASKEEIICEKGIQLVRIDGRTLARDSANVQFIWISITLFNQESLQALKKISQEHPTACLRVGALMAVLFYLDFFSSGVQRVALSTAANMCKKLPSDVADFVMEAVPLLTNLLHHHDAKVLEHASICLTRIAEAFASSPEKLDELYNHGLVAQAAGLISISNSRGQASLSTSMYTGLIRLLSTCLSGFPLGAKTLLLGISGILKDVLSGSGIVASISISPVLTCPAEQ